MAAFETCQRCKCCSTNAQGECYGGCLECGHHEECQNCIDNRKAIDQFYNAIVACKEELDRLIHKLV